MVRFDHQGLSLQNLQCVIITKCPITFIAMDIPVPDLSVFVRCVAPSARLMSHHG